MPQKTAAKPGPSHDELALRPERLPAVPPTRGSSAVALRERPAEYLPAVVPSALGDLEAFIRAANAAPLLSPEEEREYALALRDDNDLRAAQALVVSHLRLVISIARGYLGYGLPHADLIQEGSIGLMKAIRHFDPDRGTRLMTFANQWIRSEIQDYVVRNWRLVRLATTKNQRKLFFNLRQLRADNHALTAQEASDIATRLNVKPAEVYEMDTRLYGGDTSFDGAVVRDDDDRLPLAPSERLSRDEDEPTSQLEERSRSRLTRDGLSLALASLDPRSRRVIEARWLRDDSGDGPPPATLQELADELGVSAERVRQIEKKALAAMRATLSERRPEVIEALTD